MSRRKSLKESLSALISVPEEKHEEATITEPRSERPRLRFNKHHILTFRISPEQDEQVEELKRIFQYHAFRKGYDIRKADRSVHGRAALTLYLHLLTTEDCLQIREMWDGITPLEDIIVNYLLEKIKSCQKST